MKQEDSNMETSVSEQNNDHAEQSSEKKNVLLRRVPSAVAWFIVGALSVASFATMIALIVS